MAPWGAAGCGSPPGKEPSRLTADPPAIDLAAIQLCLPRATQEVTLENTGELALTWSASTAAGWLAVAPGQGALEPAQQATLTVTLEPAGLGTGVHEAQLTIDSTATDMLGDAKESLVIPVSLHLQDAFHAPAAAILPRLDGTVEPWEWADAGSYRVSAVFPVNGRLDEGIVRFKHYLLEEGASPDCGIYPENPGYRIPCGRYLLVALEGHTLDQIYLLFDEGDDGYRGSGSSDGALTSNQEDLKDTSFSGFNIQCQDFLGWHAGCPEPTCRPWRAEDCWRCDVDLTQRFGGESCAWSEDPSLTADTIYSRRRDIGDGWYWDDGGLAHWTGVGPAAPDSRSTITFWAFIGDHQQGAELFIPFHGQEIADHSGCPDGMFCDLSDIDIQPGDRLGIAIDGMGVLCPRPMDVFDPSTWAKLAIDP